MAETVKLQSSYGKLEFPKTVTFSATAGGGVTKLFVDCALSLFGAMGIATGVTTQEMDLANGMPLASYKEYLKTYALIVQKITYSGSNALQLLNNISIKRVDFNENINNTNVDISTEVSEDANNDELINILNSPFVLDNQTGLVVPTTAGYTVTIALTVIAAVPYGQLEGFLANTNIPLITKKC